MTVEGHHVYVSERLERTRSVWLSWSGHSPSSQLSLRPTTLSSPRCVTAEAGRVSAGQSPFYEEHAQTMNDGAASP